MLFRVAPALLLLTLAPAVPASDSTVHTGDAAAVSSPSREFDRFTARVRDGNISRKDAHRELARLLPLISDEYVRSGGAPARGRVMVFPLEGPSSGTIAAGRNHGYAPRGYDFFRGNRHGGHPALDIFITDRDRDDRDDRTGAYVNVLSVSSGIVVAAARDWQPGSSLRGGKYVWIFDPGSSSLFYYAHNREIFVEPGDVVEPGDRIAQVGRTGLNAFRRRSPTHLHFMCLDASDISLRPVNPYRMLVAAKKQTKENHETRK